MANRLNLLPKAALGWWSVGLIIAMPVLFMAGGLFANTFYASVPAGNTISDDIVARPPLALTMLAGMLAGVTAFITGLLDIIKQKERALLVYVSTAIGTFLVLFLIGEVVFPH